MRRLALLTTALVGCNAQGELPEPAPDPPAEFCADSLAPGAIEVIATGFDDGTAGVAFSPDGRLFVTHGDRIEEVFPDGSHAPIAEVLNATGLEWWAGTLAVLSADLELGDGGGGVFRTDITSGATELFVSPLPGAESVTITPWRTLAVASPGADEEVVEVFTSGGLDDFVQDLPSPFGVAFAPDASAAYIGSMLTAAPTLWRLPLTGTEPGEPEAWFTWGPGVAPAEIITSTTDGAIYAALAGPGRIARVDAETGEESTVVSGLEAPTGMALGTGDWDPCALYVTSPSSDAVLAVGVGL